MRISERKMRKRVSERKVQKRVSERNKKKDMVRGRGRSW